MSVRPSLEVRTTIQEFLSQLVKDKSVLDVGCADHWVGSEAIDTWLHRHLAQTARAIVGLYILEPEVRALQQREYNMVAGDATSVSLGQTFDYVVAGELIEHVGDAAALLRNMARHLEPHGRLVITTPHAFFLQHYFEFLLGIQKRRWHPQHVAWYCPFTLQNLLEQNGYEVESCYLFTRSRKLRRIIRVLHLPRFECLGSTIVVIARRMGSEARAEQA
jgi:2-polyprenyl-3-methyl-5-hydroxy-6-metoxy-1,4-benzoquinol methylase